MTEFKQNELEEKLSNPDYFRIHRLYSKLGEKITKFFEKRGNLTSAILDAQQAYQKSVSAVLVNESRMNLESLQAEQGEQTRKNTPGVVLKLLEEVQIFKKSLVDTEIYQDMLGDLKEWEKELSELSERMENSSLENIQFPNKEKSSSYSKKGPYRDTVSTPRGAVSQLTIPRTYSNR